MLGLFVNRLTSNGKYFRRDIESFQQQVQTPLSQKQRIFARSSITFLKCGLNLEHFQKKKEESRILIISEIIDSERGCYINVKKVLLQNTFRQSMCLRVSKTAEISTAELL